MAKRMGLKQTLDWLIENDDLGDFIWVDESPSPTVACELAAAVFGYSTEELRIALLRRSSERLAVKRRYGE